MLLIRDIRYKRILVLLCSAYKLLLDFLYIRFISKPYGYYGFSSDFSVPVYFCSWILFILFTVAIINITFETQSHFSSLFLFVYYLLYFVPFTSMLFAGYKFNFILYSILVWLFLVIYTYVLSKSKVRVSISIGFGKTSSNILFLVFLTITVLICASVIYLSGKYTGFRLSFNEALTYIYRAQAFDYKMSSFWGYLYSWSRLIIPLLLCISIVNRKYIVAVFLFLLKMMGFGYDGMRLDLLITIIAVGVAVIYRKKSQERFIKSFFHIIVLAMIGICILSIAEHIIIGTGEIDRIITFRVLFLPNLIASWFIKFFETNPPDYFRQSFLRFFGFKSPYSGMGLDYMISDFISGSNGRANNGLVADCMTNFGVVGFLFQPFVVALWAKLVDKETSGTHVSIIIMMAIYFAYCLTNNFFTIILFTNGGFIVLVYLSILKKIRFKNKSISLNSIKE